MNKNRETFVVMSVDRQECSDSVNAKNRAMFEAYLKAEKYSYEKAMGCYKEEGQDMFTNEQSYIIKEVNSLDIVDLQTVSKVFKQECILVVGEVIPNRAKLLFPEGVKQNVGEWKETDLVTATENGCYIKTKDGYFITS